jgi:type VI secretion system protein ImpB
MPRESIQKKIGRVRPPRVHITYDVETGGAIEKKAIPFVVGVMADLSGQPEKALPQLKERKFVEIDRDNFDQVLGKMAPRVTFRVDNKLSDDDTKIPVELRFRSMEDFEPVNVAKQVEPLRKLLEMRNQLSNIVSSLQGNDKLDRLLQEVLHNTDALNRLRAATGLPDSSESAVETKKEG